MKSDIIKSSSRGQIEFSVTLTLTVGEAKALDAIVGYGTDAFLEVFYPKLGKAYLQPFENDMRKLFDKIKSDLGHEVHKIETAKKAINSALNEL